MDDQLIRPFILEGRLTGEAYLRILQEELPRLLEDVSLNTRGRIYFQHEGAPPHSSRDVRNFLNYHFPWRWIGRGGLNNWPARSVELSPLDYCVWGWMKELVYCVKVVTRDELLGRISDNCAVGLCEFSYSPKNVGTFKTTTIVDDSTGPINCDLIPPQYVGTALFRCMRTFIHPSMTGQYVLDKFYYLPVGKRTFKCIRIEILQLAGKPVEFMTGPTPSMIYLHFRRVSAS